MSLNQYGRSQTHQAPWGGSDMSQVVTNSASRFWFDAFMIAWRRSRGRDEDRHTVKCNARPPAGTGSVEGHSKKHVLYRLGRAGDAARARNVAGGAVHGAPNQGRGAAADAHEGPGIREVGEAMGKLWRIGIRGELAPPQLEVLLAVVCAHPAALSRGVRWRRPSTLLLPINGKLSASAVEWGWSHGQPNFLLAAGCDPALWTLPNTSVG